MTKEKIAIAVRNAINDEDLMHKAAGEILQIDPIHFTHLKRDKYWTRIPAYVWEKMRTWMYSGMKLKDYVPIQVEWKTTTDDMATADEDPLIPDIKDETRTITGGVDFTKEPTITVKTGIKETMKEKKKAKEKEGKSLEDFLEQIHRQRRKPDGIFVVEQITHNDGNYISKIFNIEIEFKIKIKE